MTRVLVLGGTSWLGREVARQWAARGADVTCLARGVSGEAPPGATLVRADRLEPGAYDAVAHSEWDEVVEVAWEAPLVTGALEALAARAAHWTLVSSISVYARSDEPGADESAELLPGTDLEDYGHAKVAAERASAAALGDRLLVARAGLIVGPGDRSDRFGYWVGRMALAGSEDVLAPTLAGRAAQVIDVEDLAAFLVLGGTTGLAAVVNATGPVLPLQGVLRVAADVAGFSGRLREATDEQLEVAEVQPWAGPRSLPLWLPAGMEGFAQRDIRRFLDAGGSPRDIRPTLERTLDDERRRGLDRERRSGLRRQEELAVLASL